MNVVVPASREIMQRRPEALRLEHSHIHLQSVAQYARRFRGARSRDLAQLPIALERRDRSGTRWCAHKHIEVPNRIAAAPVASCDFHPADTGNGLKECLERLRILSRYGERNTLWRTASSFLNCPGQLRPNLGSEAPQRAQSSILEHTLQAVDSENMQFGEQRPDTHGPERRERQQIPNARRYLAPQFLESFKSPRTKQLLDFCSEIRANARQSIKVLCTVHFREFARKAAYDLGGTPIRTDPKYILGLDGEQIRHFVECGGDLFVMRGNGSTRKARPPTLCEPHYCHGIPPSCSTTTCGIRERANARSSGQTLHPQSRVGTSGVIRIVASPCGWRNADMHPSSGIAHRLPV